MLAEIRLICAKDLRMELRSKVTIAHVLPFVIAVVMVFAFALDTDSVTLRRVGSAVFWVTVVFAAHLLVHRSAHVEKLNGVSDALRLSTVRPSSVFLGKTLALFIQLTLVEVLLSIVMITMYNLLVDGVALILLATPLATLAIAAAGSIYGPLAAGDGARETLLPLLLVPSLIPVLLAASRAFEISFGRAVGAGWQWLGLVGMLDVLYLVVGSVTAAVLLEET
jgi:heme exporter protein B